MNRLKPDPTPAKARSWHATNMPCSLISSEAFQKYFS